ncbi:hypothetical protein [Streptomyces sp. NPDC003480]
MSTEARRAFIPPRPTHPPRPTNPPGTASAAPGRTPPAPQVPPLPAPRDGATVPARPDQPPAPGIAPGRDLTARPVTPPRPSGPPRRIPAQDRSSEGTVPSRPATGTQPPATPHGTATGEPMAPAAAQPTPDRPAAHHSSGRPGVNGSPGGAAAAGRPSRSGATARPFRIGASGPQQTATAAGGTAPRSSGATAAPAFGGAAALAAGATAASAPGATAAPAPGGAADAYARGADAHPRSPDPRLDRQARPTAPPPPAASSRFPDVPPAVGVPSPDGAADLASPLPAEGIVETTARLRPGPDTARRVISPRPVVTFAEPDIRDADTARPGLLGALVGPRAAGAAICLVLGLGLIGGAVTGGWLIDDGSGESARGAFAVAGSLWHDVPVDRLFPPTVHGPGAGPGGADRTWTRVAVAPDSGCANAFDPLLRKALAPVGCLRLLRATYTDATRSQVTTVGLLFTRADSAAMGALAGRFKKEGLDRRTDLMPRPYAAEGTVAAGFGDDQRASWTLSIRTDLPVVVYAVSGFADGRTVTEPQPAADAVKTGATTAPGQAGLGNEATGLADRIAAALHKTVTAATEQRS